MCLILQRVLAHGSQWQPAAACQGLSISIAYNSLFIVVARGDIGMTIEGESSPDCLQAMKQSRFWGPPYLLLKICKTYALLCSSLLGSLGLWWWPEHPHHHCVIPLERLQCDL